MRHEIKIWLEQAIYEFETAEFNHKGKRYSASVFFVQQSIEKAFKALYILKNKETPGITHSLIMLANGVNYPKEKFTFLKELTPEFISTRYPDFVGETPYKLYDENISKKYLKGGKEVLEWIKNMIEKLN